MKNIPILKKLKNIVRFLFVFLIINIVTLLSAAGQDQLSDPTDRDSQTNPFPGQRIKQTVDGPSFNPKSRPPGSDSIAPPFSKSGPMPPGGVTSNPFPASPDQFGPGSGQGMPPFPARPDQIGPGARKIPGGASPNPFPANPDQSGPGGLVRPGQFDRAAPGMSPGDRNDQTQPGSDPPVFDVQTKADGGQFISIDFNNVDINILIKFMSELTGKNFVVDRRVRGNVTIISPSRISVSEAYKVFESVLEVHGFATVKAGKVIKIIPSPDARAKNIETMLEGEEQTPEDKVVTQLIPLKYADAAAIKRIIAPLISKSSVALAYAPTNTLILTDFYSNIKRLLKILKTIDVTGVGRQLSVIPLEYADAVKFVKLLTSIFRKTRRSPKKGAAGTGDQIKFVADERTNTIILLASEDETERIRNLITMLDKQTPPGDEKIRVYYLENATAEELAEVLQSLSGKQRTTDKKKGKKTSPVVSQNVKITADKGTNSLIIMADKDDYRVLEEIIRKLDIPREMVYIEGLYMDVNTDRDFNLGVEWQVGGASTPGGVSVGYGSGFSSGNYNNLSGLSVAGDSGVASFPTGFSVGVIGEAIRIGNVLFPTLGAIVQAFKRDKDIHILSTPQVLVSDNEEASIHVGKNIPYQTKSGTAGDNESYNTYEYKDVGMTLKITPQINNNRMLKLEIEQTVESVDDLTQTGSSSERPTTFKRTVETTVVVKDGHTVVIGGLIDDRFSQNDSKVPCLGDIPGLGWLFKTENRSREKTNLYFFLTPHVVENPAEAQSIYEDKKKSMGRTTGDIETPQRRERNLQTGEIIKENLTDNPAKTQERYHDKRMGTNNITGGKIEMNRRNLRNLRTGDIIKDDLVENPAEEQNNYHDESMEGN